MAADLSETMQQCLAAVTAEEGRPSRELPGGRNTVWALMNRGLVETDRSKEYRVFLPAHAHVFRTTLHADGCHHFTTHAACECGVIYGFRGERSMKGDSYSAMWFVDDCQRCRALMDGARPISEVVIQRPNHYKPPLEVVA